MLFLNTVNLILYRYVPNSHMYLFSYIELTLNIPSCIDNVRNGQIDETKFHPIC